MASRPSYLGSTSADEAVAGVTAGAVSTLLVQPLDMVKVRLQGAFMLTRSHARPLMTRAVQDGRVHQQEYKNLRDAFRTIVRQEGALALYQGLTPNLVGATLAWGSYFAFYDKFKRQLGNLSPGRGPLGPGHHMAAAALAGTR